jgi:hypothetical protein
LSVKIARVVSRGALWTGLAAVAVMPLVPAIYRWFYPPRAPLSSPQGFWQTLGAVLDSLSSMSDGVSMFLWTGGLAALAMIASLVAFFAAWRAKESVLRKVLCGLPMLLGVVMWLTLIITH